MHDGIYRRKDSPYWWASWTEGGETIRRSTRVVIDDDPRGTEAKKVRASLITGQAGQGNGVSTEPNGATWDELVSKYLDEIERTMRPNTVRAYLTSVKRLYPHFTGRPAQSTPAEVKAYLRWARERYSVSTVNNDCGVMSGMYRWARDELELELTNPWERRTEYPGPGRGRYLSRQEADRLIESAEASPVAWYMPHFIRLALNTGMRLQEMLDLTWSRVDLEAGCITFEPGEQKNAKRSVIPINANAKLALLKLSERKQGDYVLQIKGKPITSINGAWRRIRARAGLDDVTIHDLRRTFGSWLVQDGVSLHIVSGLLRHSDVSLTARVYAHLSQAEYRDAVRVLDEKPKLRRVK